MSEGSRPISRRSSSPKRGGTIGLWRYGIDGRISAFIRAARTRSNRATYSAEESDNFHKPFVHETRHYKSLHFCVLQTQSRMSKRDPDALVVDYTRTMMGFLMFNPQPDRIAMIGLGGGSLAKFCHRHLPRSRIDVVEINPHVVALREDFYVPPDDERFQVHLDDGGQFIGQSRKQFNVLLLDAYTRKGLPPPLGSTGFYDSCRNALSADGIMVLNLYCMDANVHIDRIRQSFGNAVFSYEEDGTNCVVFACNSDLFQRHASAVVNALGHVRYSAWELLKPEFSRIASAMQFQCSATIA